MKKFITHTLERHPPRFEKKKEGWVEPLSDFDSGSLTSNNISYCIHFSCLPTHYHPFTSIFAQNFGTNIGVSLFHF